MDNHWTSKWRLQPVRRCWKGSQLARVVPALRNNKMKITKLELRNIIKEELEAVLNEADPMARMYGKQQPQAAAKAPAAPSADCAEVLKQERRAVLTGRDFETQYGDDFGEYAKANDIREKHPQCFKG